MRIGERVLLLLDERNHTQKQLAAFLGVAKTTVSGWRQDNRNPSSEFIVPICEYFGVSEHFLLTGQETESNALEISTDEQELITAYRSLDSRGRTVVKAAAYTQQDRMQNDRAKVRTREKGMSCNSPSDGIENSGIA